MAYNKHPCRPCSAGRHTNLGKFIIYTFLTIMVFYKSLKNYIFNNLLKTYYKIIMLDTLVRMEPVVRVRALYKITNSNLIYGDCILELDYQKQRCIKGKKYFPVLTICKYTFFGIRAYLEQ